MRKEPGSYQARANLVHLDPRDGVERRGPSYSLTQVILSFYRDDGKGSAFERHRGRVRFYTY